MFLLDTDPIGIIQMRTQPAYGRLTARMALHPPAAFFLPIISLHEQVMGANQYVNQARNIQGVVQGYHYFEQIRTTFATGQVLPFDVAAATRFELLRQQRVRIGTMDLRIAAIALSRHLIVLTRNTRDFGQVPGLQVEDWTV